MFYKQVRPGFAVSYASSYAKKLTSYRRRSKTAVAWSCRGRNRLGRRSLFFSRFGSEDPSHFPYQVRSILGSHI